MNNDKQVSIKFNNKVTNEPRLQRYEERLKNIRNILNSLPKNIDLNFGNNKNVSQLEKMNKYLLNLNKNMSSFKRSVTSSLGNMKKPIMESNKALKGFTKTLPVADNELKEINKTTKLAFSANAIQEFTRFLDKTIQVISKTTTKSANFLENMNLLDVAFQGNTTEAEKFVNKLSEMYGLDESWGYRTVGLFKQLANAMGLSADAGDKLSEVLTQLSIDTSSLYNISTDDTASILTSALAGQTKPARRLGADITQNTLQQTLDNAGLEMYIGNLSYAEKRLVIVASMLQQVKEANNDWGRTIESVANQTRIASEQWERLTRSVGNVFLPLLKTVLPYLNAIMMVLTEIISVIATLVGFKEEDFDYFASTDESVIDLQESLEGASTSAEKLRNGLRSFDKLNVITTPSTSGLSSGISSGIDPKIMELFNSEVDKYMSSLDDVEMKATKIRDAIMEWLGFTKIIDETTGDVSFKFDHITSGTVLGALVVGGTIYSGIKKVAGFAESIAGFFGKKEVGDNLDKLGSDNVGKNADKLSNMGEKLKLGATAIAGIAVSIASINQAMEEGTSWETSAGTGIGALISGLSAGKLFGPTVGLAVADVQLVTQAIVAVSDLWNEIDLMLNETGTGFWENWLEGWEVAWSGFTDLFKKGEKPISENTEKLITWANKSDYAQKKLSEFTRKTMKDIYLMRINTTNDMSEIIDASNQYIENIKKNTEEEGYSAEERKKIQEEAVNYVLGLYRLKYGEEIPQELTKSLEKQIGVISTSQASKDLTDSWGNLANQNTTSYMDGVGVFEGRLKNRLYGFETIVDDSLGSGSKVDTAFKNSAQTNANTFTKSLSGSIESNFSQGTTAYNSFDKAGSKLGTALGDGISRNLKINGNTLNSSWNTASSDLQKKLDLLNNAGMIGAVGLKSMLQLQIKGFADGGMPPVGQLFVANEKGPELVGNLGGRSFVANQNQMIELLDRKIGNAQKGTGTQIFNIYLDEEHKIGTYTLDQLKDMAKSNGEPITIY